MVFSTAYLQLSTFFLTETAFILNFSGSLIIISNEEVFHLNLLMELMVYDRFIAWRIPDQLNTSRIYDMPRRRPHSLTELSPVLISINVREQNSTTLRIPLCSCQRTPTILKLLTSKLMTVVFSSNQSIRELVLLIVFFGVFFNLVKSRDLWLSPTTRFVLF